jgi:hypothetical protein
MTDLASIVSAASKGNPVSLAGDAIRLVDNLIDRLAPDTNTRNAEKMAFAEALRAGEQLAAEGQREINKIEAAHPSMFVAGARPSLLWICNACIALYYIPMFVIGAVMWFTTFWQSCGHAAGCYIPPKPELGIAEIMALTATLLGSVGFRTLDKYLGTDTKHIAPPGGIKSIIAKVTGGKP